MKKKILIIEDEPDVVNAVKALLEAKGFEVSAAADGEEGLKKARATLPDLVLLDLMLPKLSGFVVCRLLKFDDRYKNIPVIVITARTDERDIALAEKVGASDYLIKPVKPQVLLEKITDVLSRPPQSDD